MKCWMNTIGKTALNKRGWVIFIYIFRKKSKFHYYNIIIMKYIYYSFSKYIKASLWFLTFKSPRIQLHLYYSWNSRIAKLKNINTDPPEGYQESQKGSHRGSIQSEPNDKWIVYEGKLPDKFTHFLLNKFIF